MFFMFGVLFWVIFLVYKVVSCNIVMLFVFGGGVIMSCLFLWGKFIFFDFLNFWFINFFVDFVMDIFFEK